MNKHNAKANIEMIKNNLARPEMTDLDKKFMKAAFSIPALGVNRVSIMMNQGSLRMAFSEQDSMTEVHARSAVLMEIPTAIQLYKQMHAMFSQIVQSEAIKGVDAQVEKMAEDATKTDEPERDVSEPKE